jgi:putative endonuclease
MSRSKGAAAEEIACGYLRDDGFDIIDRNVHSRFGEIDIIALKEGILHFVEVKSAEHYDAAVQNLTPTKIERILKTIQSYMQKHQLDLDFSVDAIIVVAENPHYIGNITL